MKKLLWKLLRYLCRPVNFKKDNVKNILVIRMNRLGDMICSLPLIKTLRKGFPDAEITVLAEDTNADILRHASFIDRLLVYKKSRGLFSNKHLQFARILKGTQFDLTIGVKGSFSSNLAIAVFLSRAKYRVGHISDNYHPLDMLYNIPVKKISETAPQMQKNLNLLTPLGISQDRFVIDYTIEIPETYTNNFKDFMASRKLNWREGKLVIFNISSNAPKSTWPLENFIALIKRLQKLNTTCIITSTPADRTNAEKIIDACSHVDMPVFFFETPHIMDFAAAIKRADLLICHDSGAMHIGASVGTKTLALVGRSSPAIWATYGERHKCLISRSPSLAIKGITVDEVFHEAIRMLKLSDGQNK